MKARAPSSLLAWMLRLWLLVLCSPAFAASGFMSFQTNGPAGTTVTAGDAASYMRAPLDWDGTAGNVIGGIAVPTLLKTTTVTSWRDATALHMKFVIPDRTTTAPGNTTTTLACGDQVIVQVAAPGHAGDATLTTGNEFRFQVVIQDSAISGGGVQKYVPNAINHWGAAAVATTATATLTSATNQYTIDLTIPVSEVGNPTADIGLAVALVNDLGHSHGTAPVLNDASGASFPIEMGLTPASDPGMTCGAGAPGGPLASGNWITPSTWGVGYFNPATGSGDVTFDQGPVPWFSRAIRIGRCSTIAFSDIAEVGATDWISVQQNVANNWYLYNPDGPCRMAVWMNPTVTGSGAVKRRFLVLWGRPGIAPADWYFAGMTDAVTVSPPSTPVSFIWNSVPAVTFSDHPCMRVYVLPETLTSAQQAAVDKLNTPAGTATQADVSAMEIALGVAGGSNKSAQMNFSNVGTGTCTEQACKPVVIGALPDKERTVHASFSLIGSAFAQDTGGGKASGNGNGNNGGGGGDAKANLVRVHAQAFGVADPEKGKPYVYVEMAGGVGWAVPAARLEAGAMTLNLDVANPKVSSRSFVNGNAVDVLSPPRRILFTPIIDVLPGTPKPALDLSALKRFADTPVQPGELFKMQVVLTKGQDGGNGGGDGGGNGGGGGGGGLPKWLWILLLVLLLLILIAWLMRRPSGP